MTDFTHLPHTIEELRKVAPDGFTISERVLDPIIIISKSEMNTVVQLAGTRVVRGAKSIFRAPTIYHSWVVDGTIIRPLPRDAVYLFSDIMKGFDPENISYSFAIQLLRRQDYAIGIEPDENFLKAGHVTANDFSEEIKIPGLTATLFPYQARGVGWMWETLCHTGGIILADEMGLGKTIQIIALLLMEPPDNEAPALIVCPTSLVANWVREFSRFAKNISVMVHRGPERTGIYSGLQRANVVITTYDTMVNDISLFSSFEWSWVICDEAQAIKNPDSKRRQAIAKIPRRRTIPMTGTPVENRLLDLWSLTDFAIPGLLGKRDEFELNYPDSIESAQAVGCFTDPIILKRRVADVASDLPERLDIDVPLELDEQLSSDYLYVRETTFANYPIAGALVATLQLQLFCAHPWLRQQNCESDLNGENAEIIRAHTSPFITPKMERAITLLEEAFLNGKKVIVFSIFNRIGDLLREAFVDYSTVYWGAINGSTPQDIRQKIIDEFSASDCPGCLILNPKAAGAGLNITAATVVIHFTPVWNPALEAQASARAHRRGQTQPVTIFRLFYKDTVEEIMIERSQWKSELANESIPVSTRDAIDLKRALEITPRSI
jgi:SNF2 family DNA or RNA helicase